MIRKIILSLFFYVSPVQADGSMVFYREFELPASPLTVQLADRFLSIKDLAIYKLPVGKENKSDKYAVFAFIKDASYRPETLLILGNKNKRSSLPVSKIDLYKAEDFAMQQKETAEELDEDISKLSEEIRLEQLELTQLREQIAEITRINRLVQAQNTVTSLERRLAELQQDRQRLSELIQLVPVQQVSASFAALENKLVLDSAAIRRLRK